MESIPTTEALLAAPCITHWLKNAIRELGQRDPIDALDDAEILAEWSRARLAAIQASFSMPA